MRQSELNKAFEGAVDGCNSNVFFILGLCLQKIDSKETITIEKLKKALKVAEKLQEKAQEDYQEK